MKFRPLFPKISPKEPLTVLEAGGCNSSVFKQLQNQNIFKISQLKLNSIPKENVKKVKNNDF